MRSGVARSLGDLSAGASRARRGPLRRPPGTSVAELGRPFWQTSPRSRGGARRGSPRRPPGGVSRGLSMRGMRPLDAVRKAVLREPPAGSIRSSREGRSRRLRRLPGRVPRAVVEGHGGRRSRACSSITLGSPRATLSDHCLGFPRALLGPLKEVVAAASSGSVRGLRTASRVSSTVASAGCSRAVLGLSRELLRTGPPVRGRAACEAL